MYHNLQMLPHARAGNFSANVPFGQDHMIYSMPVWNSRFELQIIVDLRLDSQDGTGQTYVGASGGLTIHHNPSSIQHLFFPTTPLQLQQC